MRSVLGRGGGDREGKQSEIISGGKPVFLSVMNSPRACMRWAVVHGGAPCPMEQTSFSRMSRALVRAAQVRML